MKKVLLPVDGSDCALRATQYVINNLQHFAAGPELHLLNVQPSLPSDVGRFINADDLKHYHQDEAKKELQSVRSTLDTAGVKYQVHIVVGDPAQSIVRFADEQGCDQIVMGTHGRTGLAGAVMGSVATKTLHLSKVPVLVVK